VVNGPHSWVAIVVLFGVMVLRLVSSRRQKRGGRPQTSSGALGFTSSEAQSMPSRRPDPGPGPTPVHPVETTFTGTAPGWFADPFVRHEQRYWSGTVWTGQVQDQGMPSVDPPPPRARPT
jgi:hypothetical protein